MQISRILFATALGAGSLGLALTSGCSSSSSSSTTGDSGSGSSSGSASSSGSGDAAGDAPAVSIGCSGAVSCSGGQICCGLTMGYGSACQAAPCGLIAALGTSLQVCANAASTECPAGQVCAADPTVTGVLQAIQPSVPMVFACMPGAGGTDGGSKEGGAADSGSSSGGDSAASDAPTGG